MRAFLLFYPYYLLMFALSLYLVESGFKELFHSGDKLNKMYRLLQKFKIVDSDQEDKTKQENKDTEEDIPMEVSHNVNFSKQVGLIGSPPIFRCKSVLARA